MLNITEKIIASNFGRHILTDTDLILLLNTSAASRYSLINKALSKGELVRLRRGLYVLSVKYLAKKWRLFHIAAKILPGSYISRESALSYHNWIPEQVTSVTSITPGARRQSFKNDMSEFFYDTISTTEYNFLTAVEYVDGDQPFLIASPLRALLDFICLKKISWQGIQYLTDSLRIEADVLESIDHADLIQLRSVYKNKRVIAFIDNLMRELLAR